MYILTSTPKEFIPTSQADKEKPLTFMCIPPSRKTVLDLQEKIMRSVNEGDSIDTLDLPISDMMELYLDACVTGWKNMTGPEDKDIEFTKEEFSKFNDMQILLELYTFIKELAEGNAEV